METCSGSRAGARFEAEAKGSEKALTGTQGQRSNESTDRKFHNEHIRKIVDGLDKTLQKLDADVG